MTVGFLFLEMKVHIEHTIFVLGFFGYFFVQSLHTVVDCEK